MCDVIKWKHFLRYWPFVRGLHRSPVNSPHKGQWRGALLFSLICAWTHDWVNNCEAGGLRRHRTHRDVIVMSSSILDSVTMHRINVGKCCTIQSHVFLSFRILLYSKALTFGKPTHVKPILDIVCHIHIYSEYLALFDWGSSKSNITQSTVSMGRFYTSSYMCGCLYKHI